MDDNSDPVGLKEIKIGINTLESPEVDELKRYISDANKKIMKIRNLKYETAESLDKARLSAGQGDKAGLYNAFWELGRAKDLCDSEKGYYEAGKMNKYRRDIVEAQRLLFDQIAWVEIESMRNSENTNRELLERVTSNILGVVKHMNEEMPEVIFPYEIRRFAKAAYESYMQEEMDSIRKDKPSGFFESAWRYVRYFDPKFYQTENSNFGLAFEEATDITQEMNALEQEIYPQSIRDLLRGAQNSIDEGDPMNRDTFDALCSYTIDNTIGYQKELDPEAVEKLVSSIREQLPASADC